MEIMNLPGNHQILPPMTVSTFGHPDLGHGPGDPSSPRPTRAVVHIYLNDVSPEWILHITTFGFSKAQ